MHLHSPTILPLSILWHLSHFLLPKHVVTMVDFASNGNSVDGGNETVVVQGTVVDSLNCSTTLILSSRPFCGRQEAVLVLFNKLIENGDKVLKPRMTLLLVCFISTYVNS
ncbi:hypothetical protein BS78_02G217800 [Paspalum vaginatum]|nr:hypothetical protein BS78_02G217800 [Paspalum vaginatum]